jgi:chromosome segregation ATPase
MKIKFTLALLLMIPFSWIDAQQPLIISEDSLKIGNSSLPALTINIPEAGYEKTLKAWTRELQSGTKSKVVTENGEMSIFGAKIKDISQNPLNIYSKLTAVDSALQLTASFELKKDQYIERGSNEADFNKASIFLKEFARSQYIDVAKDQADKEEKILRDLQKELSSLENEKSRLQRSIQSNYSTISDAKENITIQNNELTTVNTTLVEQNNQLSTMEPGPAQKEKTEAIKDLEKRKKKAMNALESAENKINRANNDIDKANAEIPRNERMQEKVQDQIVAQEAVYQKYADKLKRIKAY